MKTTRTNEDFDRVEFKRQAQARIYERIKDLTPKEEIGYFRRAAETGPLGEWWKGVRHRARAGGLSPHGE